jgi:hypothetical protein
MVITQLSFVVERKGRKPNDTFYRKLQKYGSVPTLSATVSETLFTRGLVLNKSHQEAVRKHTHTTQKINFFTMEIVVPRDEGKTKSFLIIFMHKNWWFCFTTTKVAKVTISCHVISGLCFPRITTLLSWD